MVVRPKREIDRSCGHLGGGHWPEIVSKQQTQAKEAAMNHGGGLQGSKIGAKGFSKKFKGILAQLG